MRLVDLVVFSRHDLRAEYIDNIELHDVHNHDWNSGSRVSSLCSNESVAYTLVKTVNLPGVD